MRCDNCGWSNPEGIEKCQKCNQKLKAAVYEPVPSPVKSIDSPAIDKTTVYCNKCGREYDLHLASCPNCGFMNSELKATPSTDTSFFKKTMAFKSEAHLVPTMETVDEPSLNVELHSEALPFGVKDKSDLKKTIAVNDISAQETDHPQMISGMQSLNKEDLKKRVVTFDNEPAEHLVPQNADKSKLKATVLDVQGFGLVQNVDTSSQAEAWSISYILESMDYCGDNPIKLKICAPVEIELKQNDIILIGGLRYRAI